MQRPGFFSDGKDGETFRFLSKKRDPFQMNLFVKEGGLPTHTLMHGGRLHIPNKWSGEEDLLTSFYENLQKDYAQGTMLPIVAIRTVVFPFYADFDFKVEKATLSLEFVRTLCGIMNTQIAKFFPEGNPPLKLVVCDKSGEAKPIQVASSSMSSAIGVPSVLYKHGLHMHWPDLFVKNENALQMRASIISALERQCWFEHLGTNRVDWDTVFDEKVYGTGDSSASSLRVVGAPKASPCRVCKNGKERSTCSSCATRGYEIDPSHYKMCLAFRGVEEDADLTRKLASNFYSLLKETSVRGDPERTTISEGWKVYPGCPAVSSQAGKKGTKRKADSEKVERKFTSKPEIDDAEKEKVVRSHLEKHSKMYTNSSLRILFDDKHTYKIPLRGEGARFCKNKRGDGFHTSQNVYMEIVPSDLSRNEYVSRMRCFCRCKTYEGRNGSLCSDFKSNPFLLSPDEVRLLYSKGTTLKQKRQLAIEMWKTL